MRIMRWGTDKRWLYEWCKDYTTIEYQIVIDEKARVIEIKSKMLYWYYFCGVSATKHQMGENREKTAFIISRNKRKLPRWFIIQNYWYWFKKRCLFKVSHNKNDSANILRSLQNFILIPFVMSYTAW